MSHRILDSTSYVTGTDEPRGPVLIVEDSAMYRRLLRRRLEQFDLEVITASNGEQALRVLRETPVDLVISDWMMPRLDGVKLCREMRADERLRSIYFILLSSRSDIEQKVFGLDQGADDYLEKTCATEELIARVRAGLRIRKLNHVLEARASTDDLTGLTNRGHFFERLEEEMDRSERYSGKLCLVMLDMDDLKVINDTHGHLSGDAAIRHVAESIQSNCRKSDVAARYGGDEFAIVFINVGHAEVAAAMERIVLDVTTIPVTSEGVSFYAGVSFGVAEKTDDMKSGSDMVREADRRLYVMKRRRASRLVTR